VSAGASPDIRADIVGACHALSALPEVFNNPAALRAPGKTLFMNAQA
jgi:reticulon-4-interacting protein 1, mitochondrial